MFHSRKSNTRVNKLYERALRIVYQDYASLFTELIEKDNSTTIHNRNIQFLATESFKVKNGLSPPFYVQNLCGKSAAFRAFLQNMINEFNTNISLDNELQWELLKYEI